MDQNATFLNIKIFGKESDDPIVCTIPTWDGTMYKVQRNRRWGRNQLSDHIRVCNEAHGRQTASKYHYSDRRVCTFPAGKTCGWNSGLMVTE